MALHAAGDGLRYIDLFCGIGGFRIALETVCRERALAPACVFSSDIDPDAQTAYRANFGATPCGDIQAVSADAIPPFDLLLAGFPCQPFSICGEGRGFDDARGTLFFEIARILAAHRPRAFVLENVKRLAGHDGGRTLRRIREVLEALGYCVSHRVLNALHFGVPQKRERLFIVGFREPSASSISALSASQASQASQPSESSSPVSSISSSSFQWPVGGIPMRSLAAILETDVAPYYHASAQIRQNRLRKYAGGASAEPTIWHENKGGHISAYPYSCALRAGASYNYLLVNGERRLTEREMLRLQGFPETFQIACGYAATRKQAGNSVAVPCVAAVLRSVFNAMGVV